MTLRRRLRTSASAVAAVLLFAWRADAAGAPPACEVRTDPGAIVVVLSAPPAFSWPRCVANAGAGTAPATKPIDAYEATHAGADGRRRDGA